MLLATRQAKAFPFPRCRKPLLCPSLALTVQVVLQRPQETAHHLEKEPREDLCLLHGVLRPVERQESPAAYVSRQTGTPHAGAMISTCLAYVAEVLRSREQDCVVWQTGAATWLSTKTWESSWRTVKP